MHVERLADAIVERLSPLLAQLVASIAVPTEAPGLLDIAEVAEKLGVSEVTVRRMVRAGMPHRFVSSRLRFELDECLAWNAARGKGSVTPAPAGATLMRRR